MRTLAMLLLTTTAAYADGLTLTLGRFNSDGTYAHQPFSVRSTLPGAAQYIRVECGFFRKDELLDVDSAYVVDLQPNGVGYAVVMGNPKSDHADCRITGRN